LRYHSWCGGRIAQFEATINTGRSKRRRIQLHKLRLIAGDADTLWRPGLVCHSWAESLRDCISKSSNPERKDKMVALSFKWWAKNTG
jgi:hypothetical protein